MHRSYPTHTYLRFSTSTLNPCAYSLRFWSRGRHSSSLQPTKEHFGTCRLTYLLHLLLPSLTNNECTTFEHVMRQCIRMSIDCNITPDNCSELPLTVNSPFNKQLPSGLVYLQQSPSHCALSWPRYFSARAEPCKSLELHRWALPHMLTTFTTVSEHFNHYAL